MSVDFTARAVELFRRAAGHDEAHEYEEAYRWYMESVDVFLTAVKYETKNPTKRDMLKKKVREIIERAEAVKEYLDGAKESGGGAGGAATAARVTGKDKKKDDDDEKSRLRGNMEGAIVKSTPNVPWDAVAGLEAAKEALKEAVIMPMRFPQLFTGTRKPWKGILLYGPPGTGKSYLAKAVATEGSGTFFSIAAADIMSRWLGEAEKLVRTLFEMARDAYKEVGRPSIIFIDEVDSLCSSRSDGENDASRRIKTEFLVQMQGVGHDDDGVLVLAATNIPWNLDSAIRRRFERRIYIPLPDKRARMRMFHIHLGSTPQSLTQSDFEELAAKTEMYSGSDIEVFVRNAMMESIRALSVATHFKNVVGPDPNDASKSCSERLVPCSPGDEGAFAMTATELPNPNLVMSLPVTPLDFYKALRVARPSVRPEDVDEHVQFTKDFGQEG